MEDGGGVGACLGAAVCLVAGDGCLGGPLEEEEEEEVVEGTSWLS